MLYYKAWLYNLLTVLCLIMENICKVGVSLTLMQSFQQIINCDFQQFLIMLSIMISLWIAIFFCNFYRQSVRIMLYIK